MKVTTIKYLSSLLIAFVCISSYAEVFTSNPKDKFIGTWDIHSGAISFFVKDVGGKRNARVLFVDENAEGDSPKLSIEMTSEDLEDFKDMIQESLARLDAPESQTVFISPLGNKETRKTIGKLLYPDGILTFVMVNPVDIKGYVTITMKKIDKKYQYTYWMEAEDLKLIKKLIDKTLSKV